ncbi:MAG: thioredoxin domain-containing protein [Byssovorax sp.]
MTTPRPDGAARPRKSKTKSRGEAEAVAAAQVEAEAAADPVRTGPLAALLGLLALGVVVAVYLAVAHLELFHGTGSFHSLCNFGEHLSCDAVNTSDESEIFGVAIATFAVPFYVVLGFLTLHARRAGAGAGAGRARLALALGHLLSWGAVAYSAYLLAVMVGKLKTLCLFCLTLDTVNVSALVLTAVAARRGPRALLDELRRPFDEGARRAVQIAAGLGAGALGLALAGHGALRSSLEAEAREAVRAGGEPGATAPAGSGGPAGAGRGAADDGAEADPPKGARKLPTKRWTVPIDDDDASVGPKDAKVTVVQFADFQCGYCRKLESGMAVVRKQFANEARFVFKHFPMNTGCNGNVQHDKHAFACGAAIAAECARRQGKFWPMHDLLYATQHDLERADGDRHAQHAQQVGLDPAAFSSCMGDPTALAAVRKDADEGAQIKVTGTPRTFINGRLFGGVLSDDLLSFVIRVELGQVTGKEAEAYVPPAGASAGPAATAGAP